MQHPLADVHSCLYCVLSGITLIINTMSLSDSCSDVYIRSKAILQCIYFDVKAL